MNVENGGREAAALPGECGGYRAVREIGRGAHGTVYLADGPAGRVALKVCPKPADPAREEGWEREKRGWLLFGKIPPHPGLVRVFGTGETENPPAFWVAMEAADPEEGGSVAEPDTYRPLTHASVAEAEIALPLKRTLDVGERLAGALAHLQKHHLLHRDMKPGNVLFVRGKPVIADAGLVVDAREAASLVGTPGYVPPENHGTPQGDVFSLGRTLWRIGTGRSPEEAGFAPCAEAETDNPAFWRFLAIVGKATSPVPEKRYRSASAMRKDLARLRRRLPTRLSRAIPDRFVEALLFAVLCTLLVLAFRGDLRFFPKAGPVSPSPKTGEEIEREKKMEKMLLEWNDFNEAVERSQKESREVAEKAAAESERMARETRREIEEMIRRDREAEAEMKAALEQERREREEAKERARESARKFSETKGKFRSAFENVQRSMKEQAEETEGD